MKRIPLLACALLSLSPPAVEIGRGDSVLKAPTTLSPGNMFRISSYDDPTLNSVLELDWNGDAAIPLCGKMKLLGLEISQASQTISSCLARYFRKVPLFELAEIPPRLYAIRVGLRNEKMTELRVPGGISVQSLLANAGLSFPSDATMRLLSPHGLDIVLPATSSDWGRSHPWRGGESLIFEKPQIEKSQFTVDVFGEVRKPGKLEYRAGQNILTVIREAHGPTPLASSDVVHIFRATTGQKIEASWDNIDVKIEPGDAVYVPPQREGSVEKSMRWTSSALAIVNTLFLILLARKE